MRPEPDQEAYLRRWTDVYEELNYRQGLAGYFLTKSHEWAERRFTADRNFPKVLEVGAGTGMHVQFVRHQFDEYWLTDLNPPMLEKITDPAINKKTGGRIISKQQDAAHLSFEDAAFDRVIAAHVLEHLYRPHEVLREWCRVLRPGGVMSLVLPCDPGLAWRVGRYIGSRKKFVKAGIDYDYWMAREHVNPIHNLVSFIRYYFSNICEEWLPMRIPSVDLNLFYIAHVQV